MSAQIPILEELLLIHEEWVNTNEKSDMSGTVIPIKVLVEIRCMTRKIDGIRLINITERFPSKSEIKISLAQS